MLLPQSAATFLAGIASGRLAARLGSKRVLVVGAALSSLSLFGLTYAHGAIWEVLIWTVLQGTAFGLAFAAMSNLVVESVPMSQTGVASGMNANIRTVGGALGGAVLASVITAGLRSDVLPREAGYSHGFLVLALSALAAAVVALLVPVRGSQPASSEDDVRHPEFAGAAVGRE